MVSDILHFMAGLNECSWNVQEQILHLWLIITLTGETTTPSFLFLFYFRVSKIFP